MPNNTNYLNCATFFPLILIVEDAIFLDECVPAWLNYLYSHTATDR